MSTTETKGTVLIKTAAELTDFSRGEENLLVIFVQFFYLKFSRQKTPVYRDLKIGFILLRRWVFVKTLAEFFKF